MQSSLNSTTECKNATVLNPKYFAPEYTYSYGCTASTLPPYAPIYGYFHADDEIGAAARVSANWECYLTNEFNACETGGIVQGTGNWWNVAGSSWFPLSDIGGPKDVGTLLQRSVTRTFKVPGPGGCTVENVSSLPVSRKRPAICDPGWAGPYVDGDVHYCTRGKPATCCERGNPLDLNGGQKVQRETDHAASTGSALELTRLYNSGHIVNPDAQGPLGRAWHTNFDKRLLVYTLADGRTGVTYSRPDGIAEYYIEEASGVINRAAANAHVLARVAGGGWRVTTAGGDIETYDTLGRLASIARNGVQILTLVYGAEGRLATVSDIFGRAINFSYDDVNLRTTATLPDGRAVRYQRDDLGRLTSVTFVGAGIGGADIVRSYLYAEAAHGAELAPYALTGIIDEYGVRLATYAYQTINGVIEAKSTERAGAVGKSQITSARSATAATPLIETDPLGTTRNYYFSTVAGRRVLSKVEEPCGASCTATTTYTFDSSGNVAGRTDALGNVTQYQHDTARNLETKRSDIVPAGPVTCPSGSTFYTSNYGSSCTVGT